MVDVLGGFAMTTLHADAPTLAIVIVGLPARGKTFISHKVMRYFNWLGYPTRQFNVGAYRRQHLGARLDHDFFDIRNETATVARNRVANMALDDMMAWFDSGGEVGIYDATNTTSARRRLIRERCEGRGIGVLFIESICGEETVEANIRATKLNSPDYEGIDPAQAARDFRARIEHYAEAYEHVDESDGSYIKLIDVGRKIELNGIAGFLPSRLVSFLVNLHTGERSILLTRHGQTLFNQAGRIGGDAELSDSGREFAYGLRDFYQREIAAKGLTASVWASTMQRSLATAEIVGRTDAMWWALSEIDAGICDGLTYPEIQNQHPDLFAARAADKLNYRYPQGESYTDLIQRTEPVVLELERQRAPVLVITHRAVARVLYGYLMGVPREKIPHVDVPLHVVFELTPRAYGCDEIQHRVGPANPGDSKIDWERDTRES